MTTPKAKYDHLTSLGIATKAITVGEFNKLPLTTIPFSPLRPSSKSWPYGAVERLVRPISIIRSEASNS
jgi:hypothetical protein